MNRLILMVVIGTAAIIISVVTFLLISRRSSRKISSNFAEKWLEIQRLCASRETWCLAVINADKLLEQALKKKHLKGKTMGERLVSAQRLFTNNDGVWYAHNLAKKLLDESKTSLREAEAKKSLVGVRQALRDLGLLNGK